MLLAIGVSDFLKEQLRAAEAELAQRVAERAATNAPAAGEKWFPNRTIIRGLWKDLRDNLEGDPFELGSFLRERIAAVVVTPTVDKSGAVSWALQLQLGPPEAESSGESAEHCGAGICPVNTELPVGTGHSMLRRLTLHRTVAA